MKKYMKHIQPSNKKVLFSYKILYSITILIPNPTNAEKSRLVYKKEKNV